MSPECCCCEQLPAIPKLVVPLRSTEDFCTELRGLHSYFQDCFARSEARNNFIRYMVGQFSKSNKPLVARDQFPTAGRVRSLQRFLSDGRWNEERLLNRYHRLIVEDMGDAEGVCLFTEACFPKKGEDSAGVAKQYCSCQGRAVNCQVGVFAAYVSRYGYALLDRRLFVPEHWFGDALRTKRCKSAVPQELHFKTKSQLAAEILEQLRGSGIIPFKYVVTDRIACSAELIDILEGQHGLMYLASVAADASFQFDALSVERTMPARQMSGGREPEGRFTSPVPVLHFARNQNDFFWYRRKLTAGAEGDVAYEFTKVRVALSQGNSPARAAWLIVRRNLQQNPSYTFFVSNAPPYTGLERIVWLSGIPWAVQWCLQEAQDYLAMGSYEVRKYPGWGRHMLTCMLAHFSLWHTQIRLGEKSRHHYSVQA